MLKFNTNFVLETIENANLNTSYVKVQLKQYQRKQTKILNLNTSYVKVQYFYKRPFLE